MDACITLDLEPDHAGRMAPAYTAWREERVDALLGVLGTHGAPLTAFVVGASLAERPRVVERFLEHGTEFQLHSYSHDLRAPDSREQIERGQDAFTRFFGRPAEGYRAPEGRISDDGFRHLEELGFSWDSSVFPSFWPRPRYLAYPRAPYRPRPRLLEVPIGTLGAGRIIVSLSWMKLLGWSAYGRLLAGPLPDPLVFDMHLHDLVPLDSARDLGVPWRWIYGRNAEAGFTYLERFLEHVKERGFRFTTVSAVASRFAAC